jgi:hypothetical protein
MRQVPSGYPDLHVALVFHSSCFASCPPSANGVIAGLHRLHDQVTYLAAFAVECRTPNHRREQSVHPERAP